MQQSDGKDPAQIVVVTCQGCARLRMLLEKIPFCWKLDGARSKDGSGSGQSCEFKLSKYKFSHFALDQDLFPSWSSSHLFSSKSLPSL